MVPTTGGAEAIQAQAAAKARYEEEEIMTGYDREDLNGWEFKIVRSLMGKFRNREVITQLCQEEAKAGWEMVEKFDDQRIRFKRKIENRRNDQLLEIDPYRTSIGMHEGKLAMVVISIAVAIILIAVLGTTVFSRR